MVFLQADWIIPINRPKPGWPDKGAIVFDNYSVRYRDSLDLVLRNLSCTINAGEKVDTCQNHRAINMRCFNIRCIRRSRPKFLEEFRSLAREHTAAERKRS